MAEKSDVLNLFKGLACISVVFVHVHFPGITGIVESVIKRRFFKILKIFIWSYAVFLVLHILFKIQQALLQNGSRSILTTLHPLNILCFVP